MIPIILGFTVGLVAAVPIGALNIFAISQTIKRDVIHGYLVGLTASLLDIIYAYFALVGFFHILDHINHFMPVIRIIGILLLMSLSIRLWIQSRTRTSPRPPEKISLTAHKPVITAFMLYVSNSILLTFWIAVAGTMTAHQWVDPSRQSAIPFALSCGLGSGEWYWLLLRYVANYHHQFIPKMFRRILKTVSICLFLFVLYILFRIIRLMRTQNRQARQER